jgi:hypothetical protein
MVSLHDLFEPPFERVSLEKIKVTLNILYSLSPPPCKPLDANLRGVQKADNDHTQEAFIHGQPIRYHP